MKRVFTLLFVMSLLTGLSQAQAQVYHVYMHSPEGVKISEGRTEKKVERGLLVNAKDKLDLGKDAMVALVDSATKCMYTISGACRGSAERLANSREPRVRTQPLSALFFEYVWKSIMRARNSAHNSLYMQKTTNIYRDDEELLRMDSVDVDSVVKERMAVDADTVAPASLVVPADTVAPADTASCR